jgi:hypothetical protein
MVYHGGSRCQKNWSSLESQSRERDPFQGYTSNDLRTFYKAWTFSFLYCCDEWGYFVAYTHYLIMYQIYHAWIHPLSHSPSLSPPPDYCMYHFCTYLHVYTFYCSVFTLLPTFLNGFPPHWYQIYPVDRTCFTLLFSDFVGEKKRKDKTKNMIG